MGKPQIVVVGGGLAGLSAVIRLAELGAQVTLVSIVPAKRSHSVCAQGGINAAVNTKGEGDSPYQHFEDTIYGGDFLANQPPVKAMCEMAPQIIYLLDRMGVPFNRTPEGLIDFRRFGGTLYHRTAFCGATTGQQLMYALDEQTRRYEAEGKVVRREGWEFLSLIRDSRGVCKGIVAVNRSTMEVKAFPAQAVILAVGGIGFLFGKSTNSIINTGSAHSIAYQQGAFYANGEFIQVHPTAIPAGDKLRLMSESIRGEGGRIWVPRIQGDRRDPRDIPEKDRWYFLEEWYPKYGNLVPRDIASRAIYKVCVEMGMGVFGEKKVYLDVTHLPKATLERKLGGVLEIYRKFVGKDPTEYPMEVYPAVHYSMGGLWVDYGMMTNIPGLLAAGECEYQQHGANRLGANSLLSCFYDGFVAAETAVQFSKGNGEEPSPSLLQSSEEEVKKILEKTYRMSGPENPYRLHQELGEWMTEYVTIVRSNENLKKTLEKIRELKERWERIGIPDDLPYANHPVLFTIELKNMLELAEVITYGALLRDESRGAHYKVDFPERNDEKFLKTTVAEYTPDGPRIRYEDVDLRYIPPRPRRYDVR